MTPNHATNSYDSGASCSISRKVPRNTKGADCPFVCEQLPGF